MKILVLHGPNLNLLGEREKEHYGSKTLEEINTALHHCAREKKAELMVYQSNHEGELIDIIHKMRSVVSGILINPAGFSHTSIALHDALKIFKGPVVEVHLSQPLKREEFRSPLLTAQACSGLILGFGWRSYVFGLEALISEIGH